MAGQAEIDGHHGPIIGGKIGLVLYLFDLLPPSARRPACHGADGTGHMCLIEESRISRYEGQWLATAHHFLPSDSPAELCAVGRRRDTEDLPKSTRYGRLGQVMPPRPFLQPESRIMCQVLRQLVRPIRHTAVLEFRMGK